MSFQVVTYEDHEMTALYRDGTLIEASKSDYLNAETIAELDRLDLLTEKVSDHYYMEMDDFEALDVARLDPYPKELSGILPRLKRVTY